MPPVQQTDPNERQEIGHQANPRRLHQQRQAERRVRAPQHLLRVDASDAHGGERRTEIHIIDRRNQQDQPGNEEKQAHRLRTLRPERTASPDVLHIHIMKIFKRQQPEVQMFASPDLREIERPVEILLHRSGRFGTIEEQVAEPVRPAPLGRFAVRGVDCGVDRIAQLCILREIAVDAPHRQVVADLRPDALLEMDLPPYSRFAAEHPPCHALRDNRLFGIGKAILVSFDNPNTSTMAGWQVVTFSRKPSSSLPSPTER